MHSLLSKSLRVIFVGAVFAVAPIAAIAQDDGVCHVTNIDFFLEQCPTLDPAIDDILSDFRITRDGVDVTEFDCEEPISTLSPDKYNHELILLQELRAIYYLDKGRERHLPWTDESLYDWLKSKIGGFNINSTASNSSCCGVWPNGDRFVTLKAHSDIVKTDPFFRKWNFIAGGIGLIMHEARHVDGFRHLRCCAVGAQTGLLACDLQYDESNLSPYGIQYWLERAFLDGTLYTGYGCLEPERIATIKELFLSLANGRKNSFCESPPPTLGDDITAPCLDCKPPPLILATDDGPFVVDEGGTIASIINILDNDVDPEGDVLTPFIVEAPEHASFFELSATGTFDYTHDGSETIADKFVYRVSDGVNESDDATVSLSINPVNDLPEINLIGDSSIDLFVGDTFIDSGATAEDAEDGDISEDILIGGDAVDTSTTGTYVVTYNVTDSTGSAAEEVIRTVTVRPVPTVQPARQSGGSGFFGLWEFMTLGVAALGFARRRRGLWSGTPRNDGPPA